jgi:galacturonosyltransferase
MLIMEEHQCCRDKLFICEVLMADRKNGKKLIAILTNHDDDIYCFRKELIEGLIEEGYEILVSCPYGEKLELMQDIKYIYVDTPIDRRGTNIITDFKLMLHYCKMLNKYKPDVVLTYTTKPNVYGSLAAGWFKIPYINNVTGLGSVIKKEGLIKRFLMFLFKLAFKKSRCIFFQNNENMKLAIENGLVHGEYQLIPGSGVNTERFILQPYPEDSKSVVINYIGRVMTDKGVNDYIEAAERIKAVYPFTEFNIIGFIEPTESHYTDELRLLQEQGIIYYRGSQKDIKPYIARAHATIHPSTYGEGMSNVLLESAASGRPVITTDIAGCRETLEDGVTGLMYHAGDVEDLVSKINAFLNMPNSTRCEMGRAGREKMIREFSRDIVVAAYKERIKKLL